MPASTVTAKGQTTIPKEIRKYLRLQEGDKVDFIIEKHGRVVLEPSTVDVRELEGSLYRPGLKPVSVSEMKKIIKKRFGKKCNERT